MDSMKDGKGKLRAKCNHCQKIQVPFKRLLILKNNFELFVIIHLTLPSILMIEVLMAMAMVTVMRFVG